jgi:cytochrome P450 / NADPH-cytochrome P450 reductase
VNLLQNPTAYFKAQEEVDRVIGKDKMRIGHLKDLKYIDAVLRETLRLHPTAPAFVRSIRRDNPHETETLGSGKYTIRRGDKIVCLLSKCQTDPKVYGEDANEFKPERMLDDNFVRLPKGAWKPFGTGVRACIGRAFAWQEAQMAVALLLQNFNFRLDDEKYVMKIKQTLTIKPEGFYMRATLREGITATSLQASLSSSEEHVKSAVTEGLKRSSTGLTGNRKPMTILYGSNTGTCMSLAQKLSTAARRHGFEAQVMEMDAAIEALPRESPVVIITASYEGLPPDNAAHFVTWVEMMKGEAALQGVDFAVFGCGHSDWATTYHRIPTLVDDLMEKHGGKRIVARGLTNAAQGDMFSDFDTWSDNSFWPAVAPQSAGPDALVGAEVLDLEMSTQNRSSFLRQDVQPAKVVSASRLTAEGEPEKRHLEVRLSDGVTYEAGDYLAVLPLNPPDSVARVQKHFGLAADATLTIRAGGATFLPTGVSLSVSDLLRGFVELSLPATRKDVLACVRACLDEKQKSALQELAAKDNQALTERHISLLDLLTQYPSIELGFPAFLSMLPPLRTRHYSISSSPLADPATCTITYGIIDESAKSGVGRYQGVTGTYLASLKPGDEISVSVRATNKYFHLPAEVDTTPIIMFGAGTGLAPFRGFVQERVQQIAAGRTLAPALLFFGCRDVERDRLYGSELDDWARTGAVDVRYAFSRDPSHTLAAGCKYIQDRMLKDREDVRRLWRSGAKVFTCGSPAVSESVGKAGKEILKWSLEQSGKTVTDEEARQWFAERRNERFVVDVFA